MYQLPYFTEKDAEQVKAFMHAHPFVMLIGADTSGRPVATQVPVLIEEKEGQLIFRGHIMRQTDHHKALMQNPQVLTVFTGAHTYVSPSWYKNPQQGGTWNYMSVHARGTVRFMDEGELRDVLRDTTSHFENDPHSPASYDKLPADYIDRLIKAIVGIEITVSSIENTFKLSQNRDEASYHQIVDKLGQGSEDARTIAEEMKTRTSQLFKKD